jgi:Ion channel
LIGQERRNQRWSGYAERMNEAFGLVLLLVVATYVLASLTRYSGWSAVAISVFGCASAAVAFGSSGARVPAVRIAAGLAVLSTVLAMIAALDGGDPFLAVAALIQMLLLIGATFVVLRSVLTELAVNFRTILGAISVYMIFGLLFTSLYVVIDRLQSGPFFIEEAGGHVGDYIFFSFTTLTTTGYGNLVPADQPGKMFAGLEMLLGQIFLVTLIAGLVSLWRPRRRD